MRYRILATCVYDRYHEGTQLVDRYPCLRDFGFTIEERATPTKIWVTDECGKLIWQEGPPKTRQIPYIDINSLEDLDRLRDAVKNQLIYGYGSNGELEIEIYDGYRE